MQNENLMKLLATKDICAILDGDSVVETYNSCELRMPYLSGPNICNISEHFGLSVQYGDGGALSRWCYMQNLINHCIEKDKCSNLLLYLFTKEQFKERLRSFSYEEIDTVYNMTVTGAIKSINKFLFFGGNELVEINNAYCVRPVNSKVEITSPKIKSIDREYIKNIAKRANGDIEQGNFDSALTKSRTLLEEVFCYVIEKKSCTPSDKGDIGLLYKQVKDLYKMHTDMNMDKRINKLLSGLETIVQSISEMRNKDSDAHGLGAKRIDIRDYHALLLVNSAITMADFILSVANYANNN